MICAKIFSKFFECIMPRRKNEQPNPKSDCLPTEIHHHTTPQIHKINFTWTIDELDFHIMKKDWLESCKFSAITNDESKWCLVCLPFDTFYDNDDLMSIWLNIIFIPARTDAEALAKSDICFLNSQQKEIFRTTNQIGHINGRWSYCLPICVRKKHILPGNKLTIRFNLSYTNIENSDSNENNTPTPTELPFDDILIKFKGLARDALTAADRHGLDRLKMSCANALLRKLSVENAAVLFILANDFDLKELKSKVIEFIDEKYSEIMIEEAWRKAIKKNPQLIHQVNAELWRRYRQEYNL